MSEFEECLTNNNYKQLKKDHNLNIQFLNKIKTNETILNCLDCVITLVVVGPLTVLFWRGTWELMDYYHPHFKGWPTYFLSMSVHISFAIAREPMQDFINNNKKWKKSLFSKISMRIYTYVFGVISVMQWRSVWILLDYYFVIEYQIDDRALKPLYYKEFIITCFMTLFILGSLKIFKNILSAPYTIDVDYQSMAFYFQTRFNVKAILLILNLINETDDALSIKENDNKLILNESTIPSELISREILREELNHLEIPPRPFANIIKGLPPTSFITTHKPDVFPQLNGYRNLGYPRNIQDIIGYLSNKNNLQNKDNVEQDNSNRYPNYYKPSNIPFNRPNQVVRPIATQQDPFNIHKPQDPSDINLLATGNVRFAPPVWSNFMKTNQQIIEQMTTQHEEILKRRPKVTNLILNVLPIGNEYRIIAEVPGKKRILPKNPYLEELRNRNINPKKFVLYINLYDADLDNLESENLESLS